MPRTPSAARPEARANKIHIARADRSSPGDTTIAILGTGKMGAAIAARLSESGFQVMLWNRTRSRAEALGLGTVAGTPAEAVRAADVVISSLTGPEAVLAAYLGPRGALSAGAGKQFVEMSTAGPELVADLAPRVTEAGGRFIDAPILGAPSLVRGGEAAILAGGDEADVAAATPVLRSLGTVRHVGSVGSAARLKLVANSMLADVILAAAELQGAGEDADLDPEDVFWVLERLVPALEARRPGFLEGRYVAQFALRDLRKDLDLALALFARSRSATPLTRSSRDLVNVAAAETPDLDISAVVRLYRNALRSPGGNAGASVLVAPTAAAR
jgi:3-hydroxyisobutyrate dehydrogenase-like beta-hydroxyacid dehydrogenase